MPVTIQPKFMWHLMCMFMFLSSHLLSAYCILLSIQSVFIGYVTYKDALRLMMGLYPNKHIVSSKCRKLKISNIYLLYQMS
jgi:hypothetical protein